MHSFVSNKYHNNICIHRMQNYIEISVMVTRVGKEDKKDEMVKKQSRNRAILCCLLAIDGHFAWMAIVTSGSGNRNLDTLPAKDTEY